MKRYHRDDDARMIGSIFTIIFIKFIFRNAAAHVNARCGGELGGRGAPARLGQQVSSFQVVKYNNPCRLDGSE